MFTGIIEEVGIVSGIKQAAQGAVITVKCSKVLSDVKLGDSIAINGACQTVVRFDRASFDADASQETLNLTNFNDLKISTKVNLERAMPANGRFGGHIVSGHIDSTGIFKKKEAQGIAEIYYFEAPDCVLKYMVYKGSICVNGISLTIASLEDNLFSIAVIPHTVKETNLTELKPDDRVNLESDVLAKYIEKFISKSDNKDRKITEDFLGKHGFLD